MSTHCRANSWIDYLKPKPYARLRLFCFPYAGGSASIYRTWVDALPPDVEVYPVQLPGRENRLREPAFTRLSALVQALAQALSPYLDRPFAFFGHSLGALIGFELARELRRQHMPGPLHLCVSAHRAPQLPLQRPPIHQLAEAAFKIELERLQGTPQEILQSEEMMQLVFPFLRADFAVAETYAYAPEEPLDCSLSAYAGLQDREVSLHDLQKWQDQTRRSFALRMFPGNHFFIHSDRAQLLQAISRDLAMVLHARAEAGH